MLIAADNDVLDLPAADAVEVMWQAVAAHGAGELIAPPRTVLHLGDAAMTLTVGRLPGVATGFRLYTSVPEAPSELTLVLQPGDEPVGVVLGRELGRRRTGALGGVAARLCSREDSTSIGLVGAGHQAFAQLWAIAAVRQLTDIRLFTRSADRASRFLARAEAELGLAVRAVGSAQQAVAGADIVLLATPSPEPLIEASWIEPGTHVHTLGPKGASEGECPRTLVASAQLLVADSPAQLTAMEGEGLPWTGRREAVSLGAILAGSATGRVSRDDITLYASVGLAGTEVLLAQRVLERLRR
jgi:alanine dehydrogenase